MASNNSYHAQVEKIINEGKHGPYVVARSEKLGVVTFSLDKKVWPEHDWPEPGTIIVVSEIIRKKPGWRARHARFFEPGDEHNN